MFTKVLYDFPFCLIALGATNHHVCYSKIRFCKQPVSLALYVDRNLQWGLFWGLGGRAPTARGKGIHGLSPALEDFTIFCNNNLFLGLFEKMNAFKTWHRN